MTTSQPPAITASQAATAYNEQGYLWRIPKVRTTLTLVVPDPKNPKTAAFLCVIEQKETLKLSIREGGSGISHAVNLTLPEARKLAEHLNLQCGRISKRPEHKP